MDILIEILLELYMELMLLVVPEKNVTKRMQTVAKIIAIAMLLLVLGLAVWGLALLIDEQSLWGIAPLSVSVLLSLAQIIAGIILYKRHH